MAKSKNTSFRDLVFGIILTVSGFILLATCSDLKISLSVNVGHIKTNVLIAFIPLIIYLITKQVNKDFQYLIILEYISYIAIILGIIGMFKTQFYNTPLFIILIIYAMIIVGIYMIIRSLLI